MLEMLYEAIYILLFATLILNFMLSRAMRFFNVGDSTILSPIIGTALGWLTFWIMPLSIAGIIVGVVATIMSNLILTNIIYPKINDKMDEFVDKKIEKSTNTDFNKALYSSTPEERVKYLCRYMQDNNYYCFQYSVNSALIYQAVKERIDNSKLLNEYPEVKKIIGENTNELMFNISNNSQAVGIVFTPATMNNKNVYMLGIYAYADESKLKERIAFENRIGHLLDKIYILSSSAIKNIDSTYKVDIFPFKAPY